MIVASKKNDTSNIEHRCIETSIYRNIACRLSKYRTSIFRNIEHRLVEISNTWYEILNTFCRLSPGIPLVIFRWYWKKSVDVSSTVTASCRFRFVVRLSMTSGLDMYCRLGGVGIEVKTCSWLCAAGWVGWDGGKETQSWICPGCVVFVINVK